MTPQGRADDLAGEIAAERFPKYAETLREAIRPPLPIPGQRRRHGPPDDLNQARRLVELDELAQARRRRDLNASLTPAENDQPGPTAYIDIA